MDTLEQEQILSAYEKKKAYKKEYMKRRRLDAVFREQNRLYQLQYNAENSEKNKIYQKNRRKMLKSQDNLEQKK